MTPLLEPVTTERMVAVTTSTTGQLNVNPAYRNSTISPEARGEDQGSGEVSNGLYLRYLVVHIYTTAFVEGGR